MRIFIILVDKTHTGVQPLICKRNTYTLLRMHLSYNGFSLVLYSLVIIQPYFFTRESCHLNIKQKSCWRAVSSFIHDPLLDNDPKHAMPTYISFIFHPNEIHKGKSYKKLKNNLSKLVNDSSNARC